MPFGVSLATAVCNRLIKGILASCSEHGKSFVESFVDDIVVVSYSLLDHIRHVSCVLSKLSEAGLKIKKSKCHFAFSKLKLLGFVVGEGSVQTDEEKVKAITDFPQPKTKKDMRSFLGVVGFYRRFLPDAASKISSLTETLKKNAPNCIEWSESLETTFKGIKSEFVNSVCLHIPLPDHPFILQSDACDKGIGAVLLQSVDGVERPVTFISRKLNGAESRFSIIEKECLAIVYAVKKLHHYLYGQKFKIRTDHAPFIRTSGTFCRTNCSLPMS